MRFISIVGAIGLSACVTHVSRLGPFVKNLSVQPQGIVVDSCVVQYETTTDYTPASGGNRKDHELVEGTCYRDVVPTGGVR
ncbi:MAG TPA: hypothetical protein VMZ53_26345 [Kofleriaceae bacterium]|nr:hypothetical protein [Kofleriaceae bacterium]